MNYHNILHDNMLNGEGLRVVLFVSGCERHCKGCQNPETWNPNSGIPFGAEEVSEIYMSFLDLMNLYVQQKKSLIMRK